MTRLLRMLTGRDTLTNKKTPAKAASQSAKSHPQFCVRWPQEMRDKVAARASANERTIGAEVRVLLADSLKRDRHHNTGETP